jgi:F-type H+-transporting ATPase subunit delta
MFKTELELTTETNPEIKGGFILRVGDQQIDASVSSKLKQIKRQFMDTTI